MINGKRMAKGFLLAALLGGGVLASRAAIAGYRASTSGWRVKLYGTATTGYFTGNLSTVRNSADGTQYIGCEMEWFGPNASNVTTVSPSNDGFCYARDAAGNVRSCYLPIKYNTAAGVVGAINPNSFLQVNYDTFGGNSYCTYAWVANYSHGIY